MPTPIAAEPPLIVTAHLDANGFAVLDDLRRRYFPVHLNKIPAHISLFHHLPGVERRSVLATIVETCRPLRPFDLVPVAARSLGRGVALGYGSPALGALHAKLAAVWRGWLTPQDRQPFKAHVTIQNKVSPDEARSLLAALEGVAPPACRCEGVDLWVYRGGPWEAVATIPFGA